MLFRSMTALVEPLKGMGAKLDGIKQVFYGVCVVLIVVFQRHGVWPWLWRKLGLDRGDGK